MTLSVSSAVNSQGARFDRQRPDEGTADHKRVAYYIVAHVAQPSLPFRPIATAREVLDSARERSGGMSEEERRSATL